MDFSQRPDDRSDTGSGGSPWEGVSRRYVRRAAAERLKALGHPDRLRILEVLSRRPAHVGEIAGQLGLPLATVSRHMRALHAVGIVESSQHGNHVLYVLSDRELPRVAAAAYRGAAAQARRVIAAARATPSTSEGRSSKSSES